MSASRVGIDQLIPVTVEEVLRAIYPPDREFEDREDDLEYDGLSTYFVSPEDERLRVESEVRTLVEIVKSPNSPLVLQGCDRLGTGDTIGYTTLTVLTKRLMEATLICTIDNDGISLVYAPVGQTAQSFRGQMHQLGRLASRDGEPELPRDLESVWKTPGELAEDAASLVGFISACIARYVTQIASGASWRNQQLGALAKFTAKMKFLLGDISSHVGVSLNNAKIAIATFEATYGDDLKQDGSKEEEEPMAVFRQFAATLTADPARVEYMKDVERRVNEQRARSGLMQTLNYILASLLPGDRHRGFGVTEYEVCGVVMETGFHDFQVRSSTLARS